jgi:hypothetical protein
LSAINSDQTGFRKPVWSAISSRRGVRELICDVLILRRRVTSALILA